MNAVTLPAVCRVEVFLSKDGGVTMATNNGGPAFPAIREFRETNRNLQFVVDNGDDGMSLRDYFAAAALSGLLANAKVLTQLTERADEKGIPFGDVVCETAHDFADGMLRERVKSRG
jgi:hypothetical protein